MGGERRDPKGRLGRGCGLCTLLFALGCSVYDPSLIENGSAQVPNRPPADTSSPDDSESLVFALNDIFIRQSAQMAARIGIDLDAAVTVGRDDGTCEPRVIDGSVVGQAVVDGGRGIDNSLGTSLLPSVGSALPCLEDNIALAQGRGTGTVVLWVQHWNGESDDASVTVMLTNAVDGTNEDPSLVGFRSDDPVNLMYLQGAQDTEAPDPGWNNEDSWFLDPADFNLDASGQSSLNLPKVQHVEAYVAFGRLVAPLLAGAEFKLIAGDGTLSSDGAMKVVVDGGYIMGDISEDRTQLHHGLFVGRFGIDKLGEATPRIGMCDINASVIESLFGQFADITQDPNSDGVGVECDAFSLGVTFNGVAGRIASLALSSRPELEPCMTAEPVEVDRCCPSEWLAGRTRSATCTTQEKIIKATRFDALPDTIQVPVPTPDSL